MTLTFQAEPYTPEGVCVARVQISGVVNCDVNYHKPLCRLVPRIPDLLDAISNEVY